MDAKYRTWLPYILSAVLLGGTLFAWHALLGQFERFLAVYHTIWRFSDVIITNPIATPCFWGSVAFIAALGWSVSLRMRPLPRGSRWLRNFLYFSVLFALSVLLYEAAEYYHWIQFGSSVSCAPGVPPLETPCFVGFLFFSAAAIIATALCWVNGEED